MPATLDTFADLTLLRVRRSDALALGWQTGWWWVNNNTDGYRSLQPLVDAGLMEIDRRDDGVHLYRFTQAGMDYGRD